MTYAAILGLLLQFGTTGAAVIIIIYTPRTGLGCRSLGYLIYGGVAIIIMFLTILSTILARISEVCKDKSSLPHTPEVREDKSPLPHTSEVREDKSPPAHTSEVHEDKSFLWFAMIAVRCTCLVLAVLNSVGLIVMSCLQFSNALDTCYCNASVLGNGTNTYIIVIVTELIDTMWYARAYGVGTAVGSISAFIISLRFVSSYDLTETLSQ